MLYGRLPEPPEMIQANIESYQKMLAGSSNNRAQRQMVEELLRSARKMLVQMTGMPE